jgi:hypothetical protein
MAGYSVTFSVVDQATAQIDAINKRIRQMREPMERQAKVLREFVDVSGLNKVAESFTAIARTAGEAFSSMTRLVPVMGALTGVASIAGLANLVEGWDELGQALTENATRIGTTSQKLEQLQNATLLAGGRAEDMTDSLKGLTDSLSRAQLGDAHAAAGFRLAGVALCDVNGHLRTATEVLPEVINYINSLSEPADRARVAALLHADALAGLAEQFQRSGKTMAQWLTEARNFATLTDEQLQALQRYRQAIRELTVVFGSLRKQIGAVLGEELTPLIKQFAEWVRTHQPQIIAAVQRLTAEFKDWVQSIDWNAVVAGAEKVGDVLLTLSQHLKLIEGLAEGIAGIFVLKWGIGIGIAIAQVITAIGSVGSLGAGIGIGGLGLLGALGGVAALTLLIIEHWKDFGQIGREVISGLESGLARVGKNLSDFWAGRSSGPPPPAPSGPPGPQRPTGAYTDMYGGVKIAPGAGPTAFTGDKAEFLKKAWPLAQQVAAQTGLDPRVVVAQAALESGWGAHAPGQNFFGIGGAGNLRSYGSMEESFQDYATTIQKQQYSAARQGQTPAEQIQGLIKGGYNTEPGYAEQLNALVNQLPPSGGAPRGGDKQGAYGVPGAIMNYGGTTGGLGKFGDYSQETQIPVPGTNKKVTVNKAIAAAAEGLLQDLHATGYNLADVQGFNARAMVGGSGQPSEHGFGGAFDINPAANPRGGSKTDLPANIHDLAAARGFIWGGDWKGSTYDPMHFQWGGPKAGLAQGPPGTLATGLTPPSGSVDVTVTHKNAPPGVGLSASATGDVNLMPPRTEHQQLSSVA